MQTLSIFLREIRKWGSKEVVCKGGRPLLHQVPDLVRHPTLLG